MRYGILGAGAVGCYYGGMLAKSGQEVHFVVRSDYQTLVERGLRLSTTSGDFHVSEPHVHRQGSTVPPCDAVFVGLKMTQLDALAESLRAMLADHGVVVALQNGLGAEQALEDFVAKERILGAICFLCAIRTEPGHVRQSHTNAIVLAPYAGGATVSQLQHIVSDLLASGVDARKGENLALLRWRKLLWNIPYSGLCTLLAQTTTELGACPETRALIFDIMEEIRDACRAVTGEPIAPDVIEQLIWMTDQFDHYQPSMLVDRLAGRPLELEAIFARPLAEAQGRGRRMPRTEMLYRLLSSLKAG